MSKKFFSKSIIVLFCVVLITGVSFLSVGCTENVVLNSNSSGKNSLNEKPKLNAENDNSDSKLDVEVLGKGSVEFCFEVTDENGNVKKFEIHTDKETVGEALLELNLIDGEQGDYGLYVKSVNGIVADYDINKTYWAFYIDGEYAMTGVDSTKIEAGTLYAFKIEK